ncbi:uncharacterized protein UV8b_03040 [Ustilaginoidea virens]|uniref:Uncharacterized protein n=1 Tax=Ustilaginoidea virens TaxID=1159556 RepID=A0A8E5HNL3_USTVR|nr:uncharacterized protein UV8b_03040 [Ustilaginoidea virens]QUC18799.1 hypothetical protein UV8b_03040 [Ustilaginoidea virens]
MHPLNHLQALISCHGHTFPVPQERSYLDRNSAQNRRSDFSSPGMFPCCLVILRCSHAMLATGSTTVVYLH